MKKLALGAVGLAVLAVVGCSGASDGPSHDGVDPAGSSGGQHGGSLSGGAFNAGGASSGGASSGGTSSGGVGGTTGAAGSAGNSKYPPKLCDASPPAGAPQAADPRPYSGGTCPDLGTGSGPITLTSSGNTRQFLLILPTDFDPAERLPVLFLWHWIGGSAEDFLAKGDVQNAVNQQRFIAVIPQKKGDVLWTWPFAVTDSQARMDEEFTFFDDMLSCVSSQFNVNKNCVGQTGVSSGALFVDQLVSARQQYIASFESLSGGVGGIIRPWGHPQHRVPGMVLWGGPGDDCANLLSFEQGSLALESGMVGDGAFFLECRHNCGHSEPPFDASSEHSPYAPLWDFVLDHPFWLGPGESPYLSEGMPPAFPSWCGIGAGSAPPRTGSCPSPSSC